MFKTLGLAVSLGFDSGHLRPKFARMLKFTIKSYIVSIAFVLVTGSSYGGGFQLNMLSMKATSMAGAFTGFGSDPSAAFYNPGAMTFQEYSQLSLGASFMMSSTSYLSPFTGNTNMDNLMVPLHLYGNGKLNETTSIGISVNTPFSLHTTWDDNWTGRYIARETRIRATYIQPTISYQFSEKFGVGGGPVIALGKTYLTRALPYASESGEVGMELDGNSTGFGFNIGIFYKHNEDLTLGLDYRSAVKMKVKDGDATFSNVPASLGSMFPSGKFETEYTLPSVISAGAAYMLTRELTLCLDINFTTWKSFDSLEFNFENNSQLNFGSGKFYDNAFAIRVGAQYELSERIDVRGGVSFDSSPVSDEHVSPENPDNDRYMFALGGSIQFGENVTVDLAYMLQNIKEREVLNRESNFGGNYKSLVNIFGITLNYQF